MGTITGKDIGQMLRRYLRSRSDLGFWNALGARLLKPQNPFEPPSVRKPQKWFVLFVIIASALTGAFLFFNFSN
jgi:hypothetical protein